MAANIPSYPVVDVTVREDGSAHVNTAGDHFDLPAGEVSETRRAIIAHAMDLAQQLGRPVRMRATDPTGTWLQAVGVDGSVTDMTAAPSKKRPKAAPVRLGPARPPTPTSASLSPTGPPPLIAPSPVAATPSSILPETTTMPGMPHTPSTPPAPIGEATRFVPRGVPAARRAVLRFSTGEVETIAGAAVIGRNPVIPAGDDALSIAIADASRTLSKTHLRLELTAAGITAIDLGSANGTYLVVEGTETELTTGVPYPLEDGTSLELGTDVIVTISIAA